MQEIKKNFKGSKNNAIDSNRENGDNGNEYKSGQSNVTKEFGAILKNIKDNGRATTSIGVKSHDNTINLLLLQIFKL